jgi:MSHA biogenesis protein MshO
MNNHRCRHILKEQGFTLIEMVVTLLVLGIVAAMTVQLILPIFHGYIDARAVDLLYNEAKFAVERMDRELRMSIPNTVRTVAGDTGVQFGSLDDAAYYSKGPTNKSQIEVDTTMGGLLSVGDKLSIYNTNPNKFYSDNRIYQITSLLSGNIIELNKKLKRNSPDRRYYLIKSPVTFYHSGNRLLRSFGYNIANTEYGTSGGNVLATRVQSATFTYNPGSQYRNAYIDIQLTMTEGDISLDYSHQVHIRNIP